MELQTISKDPTALATPYTRTTSEEEDERPIHESYVLGGLAAGGSCCCNLTCCLFICCCVLPILALAVGYHYADQALQDGSVQDYFGGDGDGDGGGGRWQDYLDNMDDETLSGYTDQFMNRDDDTIASYISQYTGGDGGGRYLRLH